jgi:hypothetical protein
MNVPHSVRKPLDSADLLLKTVHIQIGLFNLAPKGVTAFTIKVCYMEIGTLLIKLYFLFPRNIKEGVPPHREEQELLPLQMEVELGCAIGTWERFHHFRPSHREFLADLFSHKYSE